MTSTTAYTPAPGRLYPRFERRRSGRVVAGAAAGLATHLGVRVQWVRIALALSCFASGLGLILYALLWVFTPLEATKTPLTPMRPAIGRGCRTC